MNRIWNKYMTVATTSQHPYYPLDVKLSGEYVENDWSVSYLITAFGALWTLLLGVTLVAAQCQRSRTGAVVCIDTGMAVVRFNSVAAGSIHIFFEGYFIYNHARMASMQDFFGQLWKEYALSDSRYMSSDPFLLTIEFWTIILWGPLSYVAAILIVKDSPFRHSVQALVSTGEFYGNLLYLLTSLLDEKLSGISYYRPEPFYFWVYFVLMNSIWLFVPAYCLYDSVMASARSFVAARSIERGSHRKKIR
ncbi:ebp domain-containing protein [Rutstroemia sp. NJR-2017a BBW]|nr:ebp domain-containing protein [Rutstroemia sp. NJR-2017a BBW]